VSNEEERRELEAAGWEPVEREGVTAWRRPKSPHLYPTDVALRLIREATEGAA
jgi:hypothetical protein